MTNHLAFLKLKAAKSLVDLETEWKIQESTATTSKSSSQQCILGIAETIVIINGSQKIVHRVFVKSKDSGEYSKVGFILSQEVDSCMVCSSMFVRKSDVWSVFDWGQDRSKKIHCCACGNVLCVDCCGNQAIVKDISFVGPVDVCKQCYWGQVRPISEFYFILQLS
jgi:hypothetical protein